MNPSQEMTATSIGYAAWHVWSHDQAATVIGVTSRGVFVRAANRVLFISFEAKRGPLTITLEGSSDRVRALNVGAPARFSNNRLIFPTIEIAISATPDVIWQAPAASADARPIDDQWNTLGSIAREAFARKGSGGFGALLRALLDWSGPQTLSTEQSTLLENILALQQALRVKDVAQMTGRIDRLLGWGPGLTPSGDDCVLGLLLMLNRWKVPLEEWRELNRRVTEAAYQRTTTISANLIECAAEGQGDERLIRVIDGIVTGEPAIAECVNSVLDWGNSSGVDALVGITVAVQTI